MNSKLLLESVNQAFHTKILTISQRQAVIKLIEKKARDKRYIKNWWPITLLNVDSKILYKAISNKLKTAMPTLISSQQAAHVKNRFIGESGRLISDITEKAFDSLDHSFLISVLKKFGFGKNFIIWIEILLKNQQSCLT